MAFAEPIRARRGGRFAGIAAHEINWRHPDDADLIAFVESQIKDHDERHYGWMRSARVQLAWAAGDQLKIWDDGSRSLVDSYDVQADRIALFVNRIKPAILNWISLITARPISFRVHPATAENDDIAAARVQDKLARYYWRKLLAHDTFIDALWMMFCTGCVFLKSTWDPLAGSEFDVTAGDVMSDAELKFEKGNGSPIRQRFRKLIARLTEIEPADVELDDQGAYGTAEGDLSCTVVTGFEVVPPPRVASIKEAPWLILRHHQSIEDLKAKYGRKAADIGPDPSGGYQGLQWDYDYMGGETGQYPQIRSPHDMRDHALTYEIWRPHTRQLKNGFHAVICQQRILKRGKNAYEHGEIPLVMLRELPSPKRFWPPSSVQDLMSLQAEINITRSQVAEHKAATIEPRIIAEKGCGLDELAFTGRNEIVEVNAGKLNSVKPWIPEQLPSYLAYWETSLRRDFEDVSRNHGPSFGKQTASIRSGKHAIALQEADARLNTPMFRMLRGSVGAVGRQWLSILKQYGTEKRTLTVIGESNQPEVLVWSAQDIPSAPHNVECDLGPPMDRQTTIELIDMLTFRGWLMPSKGEDRDTVYRWLGQGVTQQMDESEQDRINAASENKELLAGRLPTVSDGDDDTVHLLEHAREQKDPRYRRMVNNNPQLERQFAIHKHNHERQRIKKMVRQQIAAAEIQRDLAQAAGLPPADAPPSGASAKPVGRTQPGGGGPQRKSGQPPPRQRGGRAPEGRVTKTSPASQQQQPGGVRLPG